MVLVWSLGIGWSCWTALALWLSLSGARGSIFRHFRTYAFVLAGYSAAIVAQFGLAHHGGEASIPADRISATLIGIHCSVLASIVIA